MASRLAVIRDGVALSDDEARALWTKMSAWLDAHENDFDGFAKSIGVSRVLVEATGARATMKVSTAKGGEPAPRPSAPAASPGGGASRRARKTRRA